MSLLYSFDQNLHALDSVAKRLLTHSATLSQHHYSRSSMARPIVSPTDSSPTSPSPFDPQSPHASSSSSSHNYTSNLPPPPPADRVPPPKQRSAHPHKFRLSRKGKDRKHERKASLPSEELDDDWLLEGDTRQGTSATAPTSRRVSGNEDTSKPQIPKAEPSQLLDSQITEKPPKNDKKKVGRGRGLAKKTSQLFSRSKDKDASQSQSPDIGGSLVLPPTSRQASHSSAASAESTATSSSSRQPISIDRRTSNSRPSPQPYHSHSRRLSQDSATSWQQPIPRTMRSGSSSTHDTASISSLLPIPQRQAPLSASVPTLGRQALPQPPAASSQEAPSSVPGRMSSWFSNLLGPSPPPQEQQNSSPRKPPSAAASFLNAARQRAVDGVRHLLDSEAQPDKCADTMWVMGVPHPGYRSNPSLVSPSPPGTPKMETLDDGEQSTRRTSQSSEKPSPPPKGDQGFLRPASWKKKDSTPLSPPQKGLGNIFSSSSISLALPSSMSSASPVKDDRSSATESPSKARRPKTADKDVLKWPDQCETAFGFIMSPPLTCSLRRLPFQGMVYLPIPVCAHHLSTLRATTSNATSVSRGLRSSS